MGTSGLIPVACRGSAGAPTPPLSVYTAAPGPGPDLRTKAAAAPAAGHGSHCRSERGPARAGVPRTVPGTVPDLLLSAGYW